jgi:hypothetical protein
MPSLIILGELAQNNGYLSHTASVRLTNVVDEHSGLHPYKSHVLVDQWTCRVGLFESYNGSLYMLTVLAFSEIKTIYITSKPLPFEKHRVN